MKEIILTAMIVIAGPPTVTVDLIEINACYNGGGQLRFRQVIYWDRDETGRLTVREWHMTDVVREVYSHQGGFKVIRLIGGRLQVIWGRTGKATWTFADPEEQDRRLVPVQNRRPLFGQ